MHTIDRIKSTARKNLQRIVLPESTDPRMLQAAVQVVQEKTAQLTLVGNPDEIRQAARACGVSLDGRRFCVETGLLKQQKLDILV
jgi:phosphate acetyltransferase